MTLLEAMTLAKDRDLIAAEYASDFSFTTRQAAGILIRTSHLGQGTAGDPPPPVDAVATTSTRSSPASAAKRRPKRPRGGRQHIFAEGWPETDGSIRLVPEVRSLAPRRKATSGTRGRPPTSWPELFKVVLRDGLTRFGGLASVADRGAFRLIVSLYRRMVAWWNPRLRAPLRAHRSLCNPRGLV